MSVVAFMELTGVFWLPIKVFRKWKKIYELKVVSNDAKQLVLALF